MNLRPYQQEAATATWTYLCGQGGAGLVVAPTGSGKSLLIADLAERVVKTGGRILVVTHVKELIQQNFDQMVRYAGPLVSCGIYSAGIGRRDSEHNAIFAGIQSMYRRARELGPFDVVVVDEAHRIPKYGTGFYLTYFAHLRELHPSAQFVGYTATPYRLDGGWLHKGGGALFKDIIYDIAVDGLVKQGYLAELISKRPREGVIETSGLHTVNGDFKLDELEQAAEDSNVVAAVSEAVRLCGERKSWLVFACGVPHAFRIADALKARDISVRAVFGDTPKLERDETIKAFKRGEFRALVNVGVLTTGFDAPNVDAILFMRPTQSTSLYVQILGRGMRPADGKDDCLVLDYGTNIERHGPINRLNSQKIDGLTRKERVCPECDTYCNPYIDTCPECGYVWPKALAPERSEGERQQPTNNPQASEAKPIDFSNPFAGQPAQTARIEDIGVERHRKEGKPDSMRVDYYTVMFRRISEWVCLEHEGFAGRKAKQWWYDRFYGTGIEAPNTVTEALALIEQHGLPIPYSIKVVPDGKYQRLAGYVWVEGDAHASAVDPRVRRGATRPAPLATADGQPADDCPF